jgi:hypothetical protein
MKLTRLLVVSSFAALCLGNVANADQGDAPRPIMYFDNVQIGAVTVLQQNSLLRLGGLIRYLPEYVFDRDAGDHYFSVGADLGLNVFSSRADQPAFVIGEAGAYGAYYLDNHWDFRLFAGAQIWGNSTGTAPFVGPDVIYHLHTHPKYFGVDGLFVSYKSVFHSRFVNYMSAGINFKFD